MPGNNQATGLSDWGLFSLGVAGTPRGPQSGAMEAEDTGT